MKTDLLPYQIDDWHLLVHLPEGEGPFPVVMLNHGWKGDERVMWVFSGQIPDVFAVIAPRGSCASRDGEGYGWVHHEWDGYSTLEDFTPAVDDFVDLLDQLPDHFPVDVSRVHLVGFSQGAAMSYCLGALHPHRVWSVAGLAGFVPEGLADLEAFQPYADIAVYIAHGTQDETVPVQMMYAGMQVLTDLGQRDLVYCESDVGHKLNAGCLRGLGHFYNKMLPASD